MFVKYAKNSLSPIRCLSLCSSSQNIQNSRATMPWIPEHWRVRPYARCHDPNFDAITLFFSSTYSSWALFQGRQNVDNVSSFPLSASISSTLHPRSCLPLRALNYSLMNKITSAAVLCLFSFSFPFFLAKRFSNAFDHDEMFFSSLHQLEMQWRRHYVLIARWQNSEGMDTNIE